MILGYSHSILLMFQRRNDEIHVHVCMLTKISFSTAPANLFPSSGRFYRLNCSIYEPGLIVHVVRDVYTSIYAPE